MNPRVRFAPSPTGKLHLGGARTALSNYLFTKNLKGEFLVRIEDTDLDRSKQEHTDQICESLKWLGLTWDEELVFQSERKEKYQDTLKILLNSGLAYQCFSSKEELDTIREKTGSFHYSGIWRDRPISDTEAELKKGRPFTVRLKTPVDGETSFEDLIYGHISVANSELDDFIIVRSDGSPVYNFTNVIDDHEMRITHVIRGEDHISNTPKQILIYKALGLAVPEFAHLPMILGQDKKRLSKRHGATGVQSYRDKGYQPEALLNYLALLGWNPGTAEEIMSLDLLVEKFDVSQVQKKAAVFDEKKLGWISGQHLSKQSDSDILIQIREIKHDWGELRQDTFCEKVIELMKPRCRSLKDLIEFSQYFFTDPLNFNEQDVKKTWKNDSHSIVQDAMLIMGNISVWNTSMLEQVMKEYMDTNGLGFGKVMKPIRLALCGHINGPSLNDIMELIGKESTIRRLEHVQKIF